MVHDSKWDYVKWTLYDTLLLPCGQIPDSGIKLFVEPVSRHKSEAETNMYSSGMLDAPQQFEITKIRVVSLDCGVTSSIPNNPHEDFLKKFIAKVCIGQKIHAMVPLIDMPYECELFIHSEQRFWIELIGNSPCHCNTRSKVRFHLDGELQRGWS